MVDHFLEQVIGQNKTGGRARAMVVAGSIQRAIQYFFAFREYLTKIKGGDERGMRATFSDNAAITSEVHFGVFTFGIVSGFGSGTFSKRNGTEISFKPL